jgi:fatty acid desaturase
MSTSGTSISEADFQPKPQADSARAQPSQILSLPELSALNERSNLKGCVQLAGHLAVMGTSGYLWGINWGNWWVAVPSLVVYGFSLAAMFAPLHEGVHRTAFANRRLNDVVAWFAGLLSFYNSTFFRRYHKWHHRYTQIPGKDPELSEPKPSNFWEYALKISGLPWWMEKVSGHVRIACGQLDDYPFIPETARGEVMRSTQLQLIVYLGAIALSVACHQPWFLIYWLLPLAVGQPILRAILIAEHTDCTTDDNPLTNTRTTLTLGPVRFLMWNMPFHAEHHLYTSIPFHALPAAHETLGAKFARVDSGYLRVNWNIIARLTSSS